MRISADGSHFVVHIHDHEIALRRGIELVNVLDVESLLELGPDVGSQTVSHRYADCVRVLAVVDALCKFVNVEKYNLSLIGKMYFRSRPFIKCLTE